MRAAQEGGRSESPPGLARGFFGRRKAPLPPRGVSARPKPRSSNRRGPAGIPPQLEGLTSARLKRSFEPDHDGYRLQKTVRGRVVFAQHNLLTDPPFTRVDPISCRNMLIYIEPTLQQKIIPIFHYALRPGGHLVLGTSESIGASTSLFSPIEKNQKIYLKKGVVNRVRPDRALVPSALRPAVGRLPRPEPEPDSHDIYRAADRLTLLKYAPAGVVVGEDGEILQFRGKVQPYLEIPTGRATLNVLKLVRGGLSLALQKALTRARTENRAVRDKAVSFERSGHLINLEVWPLRSPHARCFLILFEKVPRPPRALSAAAAERKQSRTDRDETRRFADLKREYAETVHHLETLREQHETAVEELQASNEEVHSSNEELQSLNEELETSNEELESANEELTTLNEELATRNAELRESEERLREQAELVERAPLLARSAKDRIIFWSRGAEKLYGFSKDEALGQTSHLLLGAELSEPIDQIQATLQRTGRWEGEVVHRRKDGNRVHIATQWVVNRDTNGRLRAVLEVNTDITGRRLAEESLRQAQELNQRVLESTPDSLLVLDLAGRVQFVDTSSVSTPGLGRIEIGVGTHWAGL